MLAGKANLAKTSNTPGKTQLINHFKISGREDKAADVQHWYLVDLPGFGFAKRSKGTRNKWEQMTEKYIRERENLLQLFLLIDSRHAPQKIDLTFAEKLSQWNTPYSIVFTKSDKENQKEVSKNVRLFKEDILKFQQFLPRTIVTSSLKKTGRDKLLNLIRELNDEWFENQNEQS